MKALFNKISFIKMNTTSIKIVSIMAISLHFIPVYLIIGGILGYGNSSQHSPGWIADPDSQCKYYTSRDSEKRSVTWDGNCKEGLMHGYGNLEIYDKNKMLYSYKGYVVNGIIEGNGKLWIANDGDQYIGNFKDGIPHGFGHFVNDDGDQYQGQFNAGLKEGNGVFWYPPESKYFRYDGEWMNDLKHGIGTLHYRNGRVITGKFYEDNLVNEVDQRDTFQQRRIKNILLTNDDGIEDLDRLKCMAETLSEIADTILIATSKSNRSGTSNSMTTTKQGFVQVRNISSDPDKNIFIYEVDGYPADCVIFGVAGYFQSHNKTIDLVISGINGGPNIGVEWFGSGTIGAARTAALMRLPAIAISGIDEDNYSQSNLSRICNWILEFVQSPFIDQIQPYEYLTVSIPPDLNDLQGYTIIPRSISYHNAPFKLSAEDESVSGGSQKWKIEMTDPQNAYDMSSPHDVAYYYLNHVVITPMSVDENNYQKLQEYLSIKSSIPVIK